MLLSFLVSTPMMFYTRILFIFQGVRPHYDDVVLIVRNPFNALVAEWNRRLGLGALSNSSHTDTFGEEFFGEFAHKLVRVH